MQRPRPHGPNALARTFFLLGFALACLVAVPATGAVGVSTHSRASVLDAAIVVQVNAVRARAGLRALRVNSGLVEAARGHSLEMAGLGYFSHDSADGDSMASRVLASYNPGQQWSIGENLLWSSPDVGSRQAVRLWMASPDHRAIILTADWKDVGCAAVHVDAAPGVYEGLPVTVVTCDFGVRS